MNLNLQNVTESRLVTGADLDAWRSANPVPTSMWDDEVRRPWFYGVAYLVVLAATLAASYIGVEWMP